MEQLTYILGGTVVLGVILFFSLANRYNSRKPHAIEEYEEKRDALTEVPEVNLATEIQNVTEVSGLGSGLVSFMSMIVGLGITGAVGFTVIKTFQEQNTAMNMTAAPSSYQTLTSAMDALGSYIPLVVAMVIIALVFGYFNIILDGSAESQPEKPKKQSRKPRQIKSYERKRDALTKVPERNLAKQSQGEIEESEGEGLE